MSKEKDQYVNVFVRIKPVNQTENSEKSATTVHAVSDKEVVLYEQGHDKAAKRFTFDKVFGPAATQVDVYKVVISPLLKEILAGYNCTVFAYGQTSTGKTYTMEGDLTEDPNLHWQSDTSAGIIPRCLSHLFDELQLMENQQYTVRVNFLELYNEELYDLLSSYGSDTSKIKLYEDSSKKGAIIIHGLEEITVRNKAEVYKILEKSSERKQTATTLMNANSSRSHTVFSVIIHTKKHTAQGEELLRTAKLNLVDLAGSENISKSGIIDKRARETRTINQSLLTLGRVITALVEKAPHIPYRESKLTRLLQESLGGRTKTSIIATVSSAGSNINETLSTLNYAYRAKNITNRPEINQKVYKRELLKEYTKELEKLRKDLIATCKKNGIHLSQDKYDSMHALIQWQRKKIKEKMNDVKTLEEEAESRKKIFATLLSNYDTQVDELTETKSKLNDLKFSLQSMISYLQQLEDEKNEQKYLVKKYTESEKNLRNDQAEILLNVIDEALQDMQKLHDKLGHKTEMDEANEKLKVQVSRNFTRSIKNIEDDLTVHRKKIEYFFFYMKNEIETYITAQTKNIEVPISSMVKDLIHQQLGSTETLINDSYKCYKKLLNKNMHETMTIIEYEKNLLTDICSNLVPNIYKLCKEDMSIARNLRALNETISQKLDDVSAYVKNVIEIICRSRLEECNHLRNDLNEISKHINCMFLNKKQTLNNYKIFEKKIEDLSHNLALLNECKKDYSEDINFSHQIDKTCSNIYDQILVNYNTDVNTLENLKKRMYNTVFQIKNDVNSEVNQAQVLSAAANETENALTNVLGKNLSAGCTATKQYYNNLKFNLQQIQEKMNKDKIIISDVANVKTFIETGHLKFIEQQQNKISDFYIAIDNKLTTQCEELNNLSNKTITELHTSQQQIDTFFTENLHPNVTTGLTPPRKQYSYPRQFTATLPREQLIQKFQESRNCIMDGTEESDLTLIDNSLSTIRLSLSNASIDNITVSNKTDCASYITSTPYTSPNDKQSDNNLNTPKKRMRIDVSKILTSSVYSKTEMETLDEEMP